MRVIKAAPTRSKRLFLATKVLPPRLPTGLIDRPRLAGLAGRAEDRRLTVIKAPAGFGKTSLALTWLYQLRAHGAQVAWLSLDTGDDEPACFLNHLAHALRHACGKVGAAAISLTADAAFVPADAVVSTLVNELVDVDDDVFLFLDDYHLINLPAVHTAMAFFIAHAPSHVHVVLCTRTEPPLPLARLRAGNDLLEIDASALRFNFDETRDFIEQTLPGQLRASSVKSLFATTEGWAAALRISVSTLSHEACRPDWEPRTPSGHSRPFAAYLEDMLERLPVEMVQFMLHTSILERLNASLCEAVTGLGTSQRMLDEIAAGQLLLQPLDCDEHWFRYHHLMSEYLRQRLETQHPDEVAALHCRASEWYAGQELWTEAVEHVIAGGATDRSVRLMERCAMALVQKGDLLTVLEWQRRFPACLIDAQAKVTLAIAWGMALAMHFDEALALLSAIDRDSASGTGVPPDDVLWECNAIRSVVAALQDDAQRGLATAQACLERQSTDVWTINVLSNVVRFGHWKAGNLAALYETSWIPHSIEQDQRNVFASVYRLCLLGHAEMEQLHLSLADRYFTESMQLAERYSGAGSVSVALCAPMVAQLRYEQGQLDEAEAFVADLMPVIDLAVLLDSVLIAYRLLVRIAVARSNAAQAYTLLDRAQALAHARRWDRLMAAALVERTRLYLREGRTIEAAACVAQLARIARPGARRAGSVSQEIETYHAVSAASLAASEQRTLEAVDILSTTLQTVEHRHGDFLALRLRTMLALVWLKANERRRAVEVFLDVLKVAAPAGIYQSILDLEPDLGLLFHAVLEDVAHTAHTDELISYANRLLDGWRMLYQPGSAPQHREALSARERNIVGLIAQGQSNKEIARALGIGPETVKSHMKSIFVKLNVERRAQAVARAQALGLLDAA
ncbi:LuxR C-terminal-related transcriptional regulator [Paraburkholderia kirstenboschensis]|uniref:LuxR C-terminal-related transcriptional regulator n=1 Tax=Paraburkholderia kirstenboschensis TaxID=1245436 RepID=A0ABZ0E9G2_9BURK|nr:LuxR C-terminal-related transcriptional regulator [Paraburkholderia kirstenboschensis]WOD13846.1 LuxR C-terminal-related transcriptional regulator [Paraburkholderia kirstenboschensis]